MVSAEATEPVKAVGVGDNDDAPLEDVDIEETMEKIISVNDDKIENFIAVDIGGMETFVVRGNGIETSHGTTLGDISKDDGAITLEGAEACKGEVTIEDGSVGNGFIDVEGARSHGAERVSQGRAAPGQVP